MTSRTTTKSQPAKWLRPCRFCGEHIEYQQLLNLRSGKVAHIAHDRHDSRRAYRGQQS